MSSHVHAGAAILALAALTAASSTHAAQARDAPVAAAPLPCRLVVKPPLRDVVADGLKRSATLRRQCEELAGARGVVHLEWDKPSAPWYARTRMDKVDGVVVAWVAVPPVEEAVGYVGHELHHVIERIRGIDFEAESKRSDSGVWRAVGGFETQAAIDAGRQVWKEVKGSDTSGSASK